MALTTKPRVTKAKAAKDSARRLKLIQRTAILLKQVSDPTRLQVVPMLAEGERHFGGMGEQLGPSPPAVSHHIALLRLGGLIAQRREGHRVFYSLTEAGRAMLKVVEAVV
jgi:DNA-binding transcriptional ArsR family regulator